MHDDDFISLYILCVFNICNNCSYYIYIYNTHIVFSLYSCAQSAGYLFSAENTIHKFVSRVCVCIYIYMGPTNSLLSCEFIVGPV